MSAADERLTALYEAHARPVWRYVVSLTGDRSGADDIVQETLLRAWRSPRILAQDPATARAWMITVARHLVVDDVRSARHRHERQVADPPDRQVADDTERLLEAILIEEALRTLSAEHRAVIIAAYYGGRSVAQTAAELEIPEGTVKSRLHYGLRALRLALQEKGVMR
ncbi:sigma-70 family RNA polymerase sigma factor [Microbacterium protaetiae]|uniref:Sigma-70 family RNA polymerase sigma factor n=1 Tax=Microbacterium protaetiae TaxID=2509458 RepID=A0A4P6EF23_9MICO|nr:sigma-70 family RNA polymerase sigma factor [Microbacterium protaetiae]QAY60950.1 sigma-70 family RNA polymerase sigma factor [Microbacterium protaetiae]